MAVSCAMPCAALREWEAALLLCVRRLCARSMGSCTSMSRSPAPPRYPSSYQGLPWLLLDRMQTVASVKAGLLLSRRVCMPERGRCHLLVVELLHHDQRPCIVDALQAHQMPELTGVADPCPGCASKLAPAYPAPGHDAGLGCSDPPHSSPRCKRSKRWWSGPGGTARS